MRERRWVFTLFFYFVIIDSLVLLMIIRSPKYIRIFLLPAKNDKKKQNKNLPPLGVMKYFSNMASL
jgi:hypothetical protein